MKRFLLFVGLGPALGTAVTIGILSAFRPDPRIIERLDVILLMGYVIGTLPALMACVLDGLLAPRLPSYFRVLTVTFLAFVMMVLAVTRGTYKSEWWPLVLVGLIGALPAAVCSGLAGRTTVTDG